VADLLVTRNEPRALAYERAWATAVSLVCCGIMLMAVLAVAIWNGFPVVFPDTGGYLARPFDGTLAMGRSTFYGLLLAAAIPLQFWPVIILQGALCLWLILLTLRVLGHGNRPVLALSLVLMLCVASSLPWYADQLMPDILLAAAVLALYLLAFHYDQLRAQENIGLVATIAAAVASHMVVLALCLGLTTALFVLRAWNVTRPARLSPGIAATVIGVTLLLLSNVATAGRFAFTPGGESFLFGRLLQDGFVDRYLDEHCPDPTVRLCAYAHMLPDTADNWLWAADSPFRRFGGSDGYGAEERRIILTSILEHPARHLAAALRDMAEQFVALPTEFATDEGSKWHATWILEQRASGAIPAYQRARQQAGHADPRTGDWIADVDLTFVNRLHVPIAALSIVGLLGALVLRRRLRIDEPVAALAATVLLALVVNAAVCGIFSNTVDRYQSRLVWLAPFAFAIILMRRPAALEVAPACGRARGESPCR
jgi:hypothetical protein